MIHPSDTDDVNSGTFANQYALAVAMADKRYGVDPNYTRAVHEKVARSTNTDFSTRAISSPFRSDPRI